MQTRHESILRAVNSNKRYSVLTGSTHEGYTYNHRTLPHIFYLFQGKDIKPWNHTFRPLPDNHIILDGSKGQIKPEMKFSHIWSQNKFGQHQALQPIARQLNIPFITLEHTLPPPDWNDKYIDNVNQLSGMLDLFISEYSVKKWRRSLDDPKVRVLHHGIDTELFKPSDNINERNNDGKILTVANLYIEREWCLNFSLYKKICLDRKMPVNPVGDTPGLSKAAKNVNDLISKYKSASCFFNSSRISPVPMSLMEAMSVGTPVVSTATCMCVEIVEDGKNGFISNDEEYLYDRLNWCLKNPKEAKEIGMAGRETILKRFSLEKHLSSFNNILDEVYGKGYIE